MADYAGIIIAKLVNHIVRLVKRKSGHHVPQRNQVVVMLVAALVSDFPPVLKRLLIASVTYSKGNGDHIAHRAVD